MKCRCGKKAKFRLKRYRITLCESCYPSFYVGLVEKSIKKFNLLKKSERILACVSGGKDSISMIYALKELGYNVSGFFIDLGIKKQSKKARGVFEEVSEMFDLDTGVVSLNEYGLSVDDLKIGKVCSACGTIKRYLMNRFARNNGFDVVATGHTSDDLLVFFFKNILSGNIEYIPKLAPRLEAHETLVTKVKPIFERTEGENRALVEILNVPYLKDPCPHKPKDRWRGLILNMEREKPGFEQTFVRGIVRLADSLSSKVNGEYRRCSVCGEITSRDVCLFCRLVERYGKTPIVG